MRFLCRSQSERVFKFPESVRNILTADVFVVCGFELVKDGQALLQEIRREFELQMDQISYRLSS